MIKIGNGQGFWGDRPHAAEELIAKEPSLDYLTLDYLAEVSLSIMAIQREKNPDLGYAKDCIDTLLSISHSSVKVVTNGGGLNPLGCAEALKRAGVTKKIGVVYGDDVTNYFPGKVTANAYLGAEGIVEALEKGAEIVICGRVADPSLTVGPCIHHFGWESYDLLAAATVAGHLIECGTQVTGGISSDWMEIEDVVDMGFPIVEIFSDGTFIVTKAEGTGGEVTCNTVKEQLLYEIGDPGNYLSPDVTVSFLSLELKEVGKNRIQISGSQGNAPPSSYKVSTTKRAGYKAEGTLTLFCEGAKEKGRRVGEVILQRLKDKPERHLIEVIGSDSEAVVRVAVADSKKEVVEAFTKEIAPLVTSGPQGTTGYTSGRAPVRKLFEYTPDLIKKEKVTVKVEIL